MSTSYRVLLVEDNPADARFVRELLKEAGFGVSSVTHVGTVREAIEAVRGGGCDAILLDLGLPDSLGLETLSRVQAETSDTAILVLTGMDDEERATEAVRVGAQDYLVKGQIDAPSLGRAIRYAVERKRSEGHIRWLTQAVEQSSASILMTDTDGRIEYVNRAFTETSGYSAEEALARTPRLLRSGLTPKATIKELWDTLLAGQTWRGELRNRRKSGELYWHSATISPVRDARGHVTHFLAVQEDITEQKRAEEEAARATEALRGSEAKFRRLLDSDIFGFAFWNVAGDIVDANDYLLRTLGYTREDLEKGLNWRTLTPPEYLERDEQALSEMVAGGKAEPFEKEYITKSGGRVSVLVAAALPHGPAEPGTAFVVDMTERRRMEGALRESEARFRQLAEHLREGIFLNQVEPFQPLYISPAWGEIWGRSVAEAIANPWLWMESVHPDDREMMEASFAAARAGQTTANVFRVQRPNGSYRWVRARTFPVRNEAGETYRLVGIAEDITEARRAEERAAQSQRLEAVGRLAGGVAHDFNNILTVIQAEVELAQDAVTDATAVEESLEEIRRASARAATLTRQLLAFSRQQVVEPDVLDVNEIVRAMAQMMRRLVGEQIDLLERLADVPALVLADRGQLEQVIANLVVNARDAMPNGGRIALETSWALAQEGDLEEVAAGSYVVLTVSDTGTGMTEEVKARLFEPFFTTKEVGKGTGLGLATVFGIVKQSGGTIHVYSEAGLGTTVKVFLPRVAPDSRRMDTMEVSGLQGGGETILVVEDEHAVRRVAARMLESLGYRVLEAQDAVEALRVLAEAPEVDLMLTDVVLPGRGGRVLWDEASVLRPDLKVLFMSGYTSDVILQHRIMEEGVVLLQKPFTRHAVASRVREVLDS